MALLCSAQAIGGASSSSLSIGSQATEQSFALQYTSLILILLTFVVGAFIRPHLPAATVASAPIENTAHEHGVVKYTTLFEGDTINNDVFAALQSVVMNHDVELQINLYGIASSDENDSEQRFALALSRSVLLQRQFIEQGVPPQAIAVYAHGKSSDFQAEVTIKAIPGNGESR